jgi:hypothetical protein
MGFLPVKLNFASCKPYFAPWSKPSKNKIIAAQTKFALLYLLEEIDQRVFRVGSAPELFPRICQLLVKVLAGASCICTYIN